MTKAFGIKVMLIISPYAIYIEINIDKTVSYTNIRQISKANKNTKSKRKVYDDINAVILMSLNLYI